LIADIPPEPLDVQGAVRKALDQNRTGSSDCPQDD
jgi:hypothetical protein